MAEIGSKGFTWVFKEKGENIYPGFGTEKPL